MLADNPTTQNVRKTQHYGVYGAIMDNMENKHINKKTLTIIIVSILTIVLIIAGSIYGIISLRSSKIAQCQRANNAYTSAWKNYETVKATADKTATEITSDQQVADTKTYTTFTSVRKAKVSQVKTLNCNISYTGAFNANTTSMDSKTSAVKKMTGTLKTATDNVITSKQVKDLDNAKNAVKAKLDEMNNLLTSSDGQVADNATRDNLQNVINTVNTALNDKKASVESLNKALEPVQGAIDGVNNSIEAKRQADAQAAAQAQAQAQARAQSRSYNNGSRSYSGGSRSYSAPRSNGGGGSSAPAPSNNGGSSSTGGSGLPSWWNDWVNSRPPAPCEAEGTCHLAIG